MRRSTAVGSRVVGVVADTHGLVRPELLAALRDAAHVVHTGDVGGPAVLAALRRLAPVTVVRGDDDRCKRPVTGCQPP